MTGAESSRRPSKYCVASWSVAVSSSVATSGVMISPAVSCAKESSALPSGSA
jgi:hypothetical protein